ncbi:MAG: hypothetical protein O3B95_09110 [Chloroflexi bacterium]|nr:hypothetical protein [Chloroflexota bacterium]
MSRQVPEPWNGNIETAPILYVSSNPSISEDEVYPTGHWDDISMAEYFSKRFNTRWVIDGSRSLEKDGTYSKPVKFWSTVRNGTTEFIERPAVPGEDYALTEVVHCKSKTDDVAASAVDHCANRYLDRVLGISPARIIGVMGAKAGSVFADLLEVERRVGGIHTASLGNTTRSIVFLGGPGADPHPKKILTACAPQDVETVRRYFRGDGDVA